MRGKILFVSPKMWFFIKQEFHADGRDATNLPEIYGHISGTAGLAPADLEPGLLVEYAESKRNGRPCAVNIKRYVPATKNPEYPFEPTPEPAPVIAPELVQPKIVGAKAGPAATPAAARSLAIDSARTTQPPSAKTKAILAAESGDRLRSQRELPLTDGDGSAS